MNAEILKGTNVPDQNFMSRRAQSLIDIFVSVFAAMMLWPFPIARAALSLPVHVAGVLVSCFIVQLAYFSVCAVVWNRTLGMRLAGIGVYAHNGGSPTRRQALLWGLISALIAVWFAVAPRQAGLASVAERASATTVY